MAKINFRLWFDCRNEVVKIYGYRDWQSFLEWYKEKKYFNWSIVAEMETDAVKLYLQKMEEQTEQIVVGGKLRIVNAVVRFLKNWFMDACPECGSYKVTYMGDDYDGDYLMDIFYCKNCKKQFKQDKP